MIVVSIIVQSIILSTSKLSSFEFYISHLLTLSSSSMYSVHNSYTYLSVNVWNDDESTKKLRYLIPLILNKKVINDILKLHLRKLEKWRKCMYLPPIITNHHIPLIHNFRQYLQIYPIYYWYNFLSWILIRIINTFYFIMIVMF